MVQESDKKREDIAEIIYDWIHESQVTHRRSFKALPAEHRRRYYDIADRVIERASQP